MLSLHGCNNVTVWEESLISNLSETIIQNQAGARRVNHKTTIWPFKFLPKRVLTSADQRSGPSG